MFIGLVILVLRFFKNIFLRGDVVVNFVIVECGVFIGGIVEFMS